MSIIDTAITRLQQIALESADTTIKSAPQYPVESASVLPMAVAHINTGEAIVHSAGEAQMILTVRVDIHVNLKTLKSAYQQINGIIPDYMRRLGGDPTLNTAAATIVFPVTVEVSATQWNNVQTLMASFSVPIKFRESTL